MTPRCWPLGDSTLGRLLKSPAAALAIGLSATAAAHGAVINFNSHTTYTGAGTSFQEGGMTFWGLELLFIPPDWMMGAPSAFGSTITTPIMAASGEPVTMALTSGAAFDLQSIDMGLGWFSLPGGDYETITGTLANCTSAGPGDHHCEVSDSFFVDYSFKTYSLTSDFTGLSSVTFQSLTPQDFNGFISSGWIGYDNINFTAPGEMGEAVPEPASWALMIAGLGAVGGLLRGRRRGAAFARAA